MNKYHRWLRSKLDWLDALAGQELDGPDFDDIDAMVREAGRRAAEAGLPEVVYLSRLPAGGLGPGRAREYLAECIAAVENGRTVEPVNDDAPLTVAQAAKRFNLGKRTIYRLVETGEIEAARVGTAIRIRPADLETYLARSPGPKAGLFS
jgi:excisionase family DNA binding protein